MHPTPTTLEPEPIRFGAVGWLGFFILCLLGVGLVLILISWTGTAYGNPAGRRFVIELSRLVGSLAVLIAAAVTAIALLGLAIWFVVGGLG